MSVRGPGPTETTGWSSSGSTRPSSGSSTRSISCARRRRTREIDYPVVVDNDYAVWSAFANHYWPALYFVDASGVIRDQHFGEGRYEAVRASHPGPARHRPRAALGGGGRRGGGGRLGPPGHARDLSRPRARRWRAYSPPTAGPQPLGAGRRVDDRWRERRAGPSGREHRFPVPRARRRTSCMSLQRREPIPFRVSLDGDPPGAARGGRRRGREAVCSGRAGCTSSCASTTR